MISELNLGILLLQASACLALGLAGSYLWARKPARAHRMLVVCMGACVMLPAMYVGVQRMGLGQLKTDPLVPGIVDQFEVETVFEPLLLSVELESLPETTPMIAASVMPQETEPIPLRPIPWTLVGTAIWGAMSCLVLARLAMQFVLGLRLLRGRQWMEDDSLTQALCIAKQRLDFNRPVFLYFSPKISSPVIWCWSKTPLLLIQDISTQTQMCKDWVGVFCHELAHAKRLDHITNLWADLLCVALPWHPLVWWARVRLIRLSEDVCDDWVLIQGHASTKYAESLLSLTSQKQLAGMPSIIGKDSTMKARISRIIKGKISNPRPGTGWTCLWVAVALCSIVGMALAQPRPEEELRAMEEAHEPMERGAIEREEPLDFARIGRLNVLQSLLGQLTKYTQQTEQAFKEATNDSNRKMHQVELATLREQIARIEKQIQQTKHPEPVQDMDLYTLFGISNTPGEIARRPVRVYEDPGTAQYTEARKTAQERSERVLIARRRQIEAELKAVEPDLRRRHEAGLIPTQEVEGKLRTLKNELGLIDAQLGANADIPKQQVMIYRLEYGRASQIVDILTRLMTPKEVIVSDQDTNSVIINATPDRHKEIQQLLEQLDTPRPRSTSRSTSGPARTSSSTSRTRPGLNATRGSTSSAPALVQATRSRSARVSSLDAVTRSPVNSNLNAEVDDLRGQVKGLNEQMKEMRALLELLVKQKQAEKPTSSEPPPSTPF